MYDLRNISGSKHLRAVGLVLLGALCAFQVNAAPFISTSSGNSTTFSPGTYARDAAAVNAALVITAGTLYATQSASLRTIAGTVVPLVVRAAPVAGAVGSAVLSCFGNPACVALVGIPLVAAVAANMGSGSGSSATPNFTFSYDPATNTPTVRKSDPEVCVTAPCFDYRMTYNGKDSGYMSAKSLAAWLGAQVVALNPGYIFTVAPYPVFSPSLPGVGQIQYTGHMPGYSDFSSSYSWVSRSISPSADPTVPSTPVEFADAIDKKTDWAPDSKIIELLEKIVKNTSASIPVQIPTITGPTSIAETPTVQTKADGTKTTTSKTTSIGYFGPTATATQQVVETSTSPTGVITTTSTTDSPAYVEEKKPATDYDIPGDEIPRTKKTITFSAENLGFAGGACPANVMQTINGKTIKLIDWTSNCGYVTTYAKPMILAAAVFAALMIIFVGGKPE